MSELTCPDCRHSYEVSGVDGTDNVTCPNCVAVYKAMYIAGFTDGYRARTPDTAPAGVVEEREKDLYFMRDNHTFRKMRADHIVEDALRFFDEDHLGAHGMVRIGGPKGVYVNAKGNRQQFKRDLLAALSDSTAPAGCEGCVHFSNGRPDVECHPCKRYPHKYPDHYTPREGKT